MKLMQIFELYFNPKTKKDKIINGFAYEPINIEQKKLGNLYMLGELLNISPRNLQLLDRLASITKNYYYQNQKLLPEKAFIENLKKINEFLFNKAKAGNVSWLGNLSFIILNLNFFSFDKNQTEIKKFNFLFTKTGKIEAVLLRAGDITNIGENLISEEIETYPLKIFKNIVSGELEENDILLLATNEIYNYFLKENLLKQFASLSILQREEIKNAQIETVKSWPESQEIEFNKIKEQIKKIIYSKEKNLLDISGICFLIILEKTSKEKKGGVQRERLIFEKEISKSLIFQFYSFVNKKVKIFLNLLKKGLFSQYSQIAKKSEYSTNFLSDYLKKIGKLKTLIYLIRFNKFKNLILLVKNPRVKKNLSLIIFLILLLLIGYFLFR